MTMQATTALLCPGFNKHFLTIRELIFSGMHVMVELLSSLLLSTLLLQIWLKQIQP